MLVDSSMWIDLLNQRSDDSTARLSIALQQGSARVVVPDLVAHEVLRGIGDGKRRQRAWQLLSSFHLVAIVGFDRARRAADRYAELRSVSRTVRKANDVLIASYCLDEGLPLLFSDRDFPHFVEHLGMRRA